MSDIFEFNHIEKSLSESDIKTLKDWSGAGVVLGSIVKMKNYKKKIEMAKSLLQLMKKFWLN